MQKKIILIIIDGLGDRRTDRKTPLEAAKTPFMDRLAKEGSCGLHYPLKPGIPIGSGLAHTLIFGYGEDDYPGRGVLEAYGAGIDLRPTDLAFRVNFATAGEDYIILDRRAGRRGEFIPQLAEELENILNKNPFGIKVILKAYENYRGTLVLRGSLLNPIPDLDPQRENEPLPFSKDETTGRIVNWIITTAYEFLRDHPLNKKREEMGLPPANILLLRGAGKIKQRILFEDKYGIKALAIADRNLYLGVASYFGMDTVRTSDEEKVKVLLNNFEDYDFFFLHFKMADVYGHDGKWEEKKSYLEYVDSLLSSLEEVKERSVIVITGDHSTPVPLKDHSGDAVPLLIYGGNRDDTRAFHEHECVKGRIGVVRASDIMNLALDAAGRMKEVGK